jgi:hypothetical protein
LTLEPLTLGKKSIARSVTGSCHPVLKKIDAVPIFFWVVGFWRGILLAIFCNP